ncbi:hypothetical protein K469DRAFT_306352 [Zopfia rhizophila CBS 207.26]|uniref:Lytic polysaccharide monooxygenase n=1 Tax=Zopfia rhizophila CBS 207.26 TaxID=1314779 RepID=A0A6A6EM75_9PEZI|nr:hypothetical protein K469DRAFT_306352 [Zopfia rhizophila CBS 207.26]
MKSVLLIAAVLAASANGAVIEGRQRPTGRPGGNPAGPDGTNSLWIGRPTQSVTFFPGNPSGDISECGLDAFAGHSAEASLFCSSILKSGTATQTQTYTTRQTVTTTRTVITTVTAPRPPSSTPSPPRSSSRPPSSTPMVSYYVPKSSFTNL